MLPSFSAHAIKCSLSGSAQVLRRLCGRPEVLRPCDGRGPRVRGGAGGRGRVQLLPRVHGRAHHQPGESHHCGDGNTDVILILTPYLQSEREIRARTFQFELSEAGAGGQGVQFPANADPVLNVIYKLRGLSPAQEAAPPPPPPPEAARSSPTSSAASNSDSGIGYRDEAPHPQVGNLSITTLLVFYMAITVDLAAKDWSPL